MDQLELKLQASEVQGSGTAGKLSLTLQESRGFETQVSAARIILVVHTGLNQWISGGPFPLICYREGLR